MTTVLRFVNSVHGSDHLSLSSSPVRNEVAMLAKGHLCCIEVMARTASKGDGTIDAFRTIRRVGEPKRRRQRSFTRRESS